jgi:hypothetical protein
MALVYMIKVIIRAFCLDISIVPTRNCSLDVYYVAL